MKNQEYLELCDIASIQVFTDEYRKELREVYKSRIPENPKEKKQVAEPSRSDIIRAFRGV